MAEIVYTGSRKYAAVTPMCCGLSRQKVDFRTLQRVAATLQWDGPEDFSLNVIRMDDEKRRADALSIPVMHAPLEGFIAQRDVFTQELATVFPCLPPHKITAAQRAGMRAWHEAEAARLKSKNPALAQWSEQMQGHFSRLS